jgi:hypothetical protein
LACSGLVLLFISALHHAQGEVRALSELLAGLAVHLAWLACEQVGAWLFVGWARCFFLHLAALSE